MLQTLASRATPTPRWRPLAWVMGVVALLLLAAWAVPPMLDWGRFRTAIASIAAARLGRPVVIGGDISLRLLPQAVLTASDVTLADQGDGISVQVAALRLQVATLPLVAGRLVLRDLVLSAPVLHVPWALPGGLGQSTRPQVPHPFAARIENGTLRIGEAEITGITASIHGGPAIGGAEPAPADVIPVAAFGAEGFASAGGRSWRFTGALGAPDADGVSAVDIAVRGQGAAGNTDGLIQGTLADGVMQGRLRASGPDLSLLMPASAAQWRAEAPFVASGDGIELNAIGLSLGGAPADGALVLRLDRPARLDGHLHAAALDLNGWAALLGRSLRARPRLGATLPMRIGLSADSARLLDGHLSGVQAMLVSDGTSLGFDHAEASLPGGAHLASEHARLVPADPKAAGGQLALAGAASLSAPDLRATLGWLRTLAPGLADAMPMGVLRQATLSGTLTLRAGGADVSGMTGRLDGSPVNGGVSVRLGQRPSLAATLDFETLPLDPWLDAVSQPGSLAALGQFFTGAETSLHIKATQTSMRRVTLDRLVLDAQTGLGGLALQHAEADWNTAKMSLAGSLRPDGSVSGARLSIRSPSLEAILPQLPSAWRWAPALWQSAGTLQLAADGPPQLLALQLRADAGDMVIEADALRNTLAGTGTTTLTLRHPGAPRLLTQLGVPQALGLPGGLEQTAHWLDTGALTLRAHLQDGPNRVTVSDFDLDAAALRLSGQVAVDWSGKTPTLTGTLAFDQLALPDVLPILKPVACLAGWAAHLHVSAADVTVALRPTASGASADLDMENSRVHASAIAASVAGGKLAGDVTADLASLHLTTHARLTNAQITVPLTGWPLDVTAGMADLALELDMAGSSPAALSGTVSAQMHDAQMAGFNLTQLTAAAPLHTKAGREAVKMALSQGHTTGLSGNVAATVSHGRLILSSARLESADGSATIEGGADLAAETVDAHVMLSPAPPSSAEFGTRLSGAWNGPSVMVDRGRKQK